MYHFQRFDDVAVDPAEPFKHDVLQREQFANNLTALLSSLTQPIVIGLDGSLGTGKTTFTQMWRPLLDRAGHQTVYFNAWENDYAGDPLVALMASIQEQVTATADVATSQAWRRARRVGSNVVRAFIPLAVRLGTQGLMNLEELKKVLSEDSGDDVAECVSDYAADRINEHLQARESIAAFRRLLADFADKLVQHLDGMTRSLVIIVDELDRCRPTFALETLERIKHLFNVDRVVFVLSLDRKQLIHSVRAVYGGNFDAENYLRRFIDLNITMPPARGDGFFAAMFKSARLEQLIEPEEAGSIGQLFSALASAFHSSLRTQQQLFAEFNVAARILQGESFGAAQLALVLIFVRAHDRQRYDEYMAGSGRGKDLEAYLRQLPPLAEYFSRSPYLEVVLLLYSTTELEREQAIAELMNEAEAPNKSRERRNRARSKATLLSRAYVNYSAVASLIEPALAFTGRVHGGTSAP